MKRGDDLIERASRFARQRHEGQFRKYSNAPYVFHPGMVAWLLTVFKTSKNRDILVAALLLHDTVEDCGVTFWELEREFGTNVASIVMELTNDKSIIGGDEKENYMIHKLLTMSTYALTAKLCDILHNLSDLNPRTHFGWGFIHKTTVYVKVLEDERSLTSSQRKILDEIIGMLSGYKEGTEGGM